MDVEWREILPARPSSVFMLFEKAFCPSVRAFPRKRLRHSLTRLMFGELPGQGTHVPNK